MITGVAVEITRYNCGRRTKVGVARFCEPCDRGASWTGGVTLVCCRRLAEVVAGMFQGNTESAQIFLSGGVLAVFEGRGRLREFSCWNLQYLFIKFTLMFHSHSIGL